MEKRRKILILCSFLLLFFLTGCAGNKDIKLQITEMLDYYQQGDMTQMETYTISGQGTSSDDNPASAAEDAMFQDETVDYDFFEENVLVSSIAKQSEFSIGKISEEENTATVSITVKSPDMQSIIVEIISKPDIQTLSDDDIMALLKQAIESGDPVKTKFDINLVKIEGVWLVDATSITFRDRLTGGLFSGYQQLYLKALQETQQAFQEESE